MTQLTKQLTIIENQAIQAIEPEGQIYVLARQAEMPLAKYLPNDLKRLCLNVITTAHIDNQPAGQASPTILAEQTKLLLKELYELPKRYLTLTGPELLLAFKMGVRGELGEFFGLCPKTYSVFIKNFFKLPIRTSAWNIYLNVIDKKNSEDKTKIFSDDELKQIAESAFTEYLNDNSLPHVPAAIYDVTKKYLKLESLIDPLKYPEIFEIAKVEYKAKIKDMPEFITKSWKMDPKENTILGGLVKKVGLKYFYDKIIENKKSTLL